MTEALHVESVLDHTTLLLPHLYSRDMRALPILDGESRLVGSVSTFGAEFERTPAQCPAVITVNDATGDVLRVCDPPQRGMPIGGFWTNGAPILFLTPHSGLRKWHADGRLADGSPFLVEGTRGEVTCSWGTTRIAHGPHLQPGGSPSGLLASLVQIDPRAPLEHRAAIVAGFYVLQRQWAYERAAAHQYDDWTFWSLMR